MCVSRESTVWSFENPCPTRSVYSAMGDGGMDVGARLEITTIDAITKGLYGRRPVHWIGLYTPLIKRIRFRQHR
jgi:hypothetical protein